MEKKRKVPGSLTPAEDLPKLSILSLVKGLGFRVYCVGLRV